MPEPRSTRPGSPGAPAPPPGDPAAAPDDDARARLWLRVAWAAALLFALLCAAFLWFGNP